MTKHVDEETVFHLLVNQHPRNVPAVLAESYCEWENCGALIQVWQYPGRKRKYCDKHRPEAQAKSQKDRNDRRRDKPAK